MMFNVYYQQLFLNCIYHIQKFLWFENLDC